MMKLKFIIIATMLTSALCYSQTYNIDAYFFPNKERKDVKMITEKFSSGWKQIYLFNKEGFWIQQINYQKGKKRADYRYEYLITDTLVQITMKDFVNNTERSFSIYKFYFNRQGHCYKYEVYLSRNLDVPFVICNNFIYKDNLLQSYEHGSDAIKYTYNYKGQKTQEQRFYTGDATYDVFGSNKDTTYHNFVYNEKGQLIDYIIRSTDERGAFTEVICWSPTKMNMLQYRYENFDKRGNWKKSYFITEKGKKINSKRKIEYW